MFKLVFIGFRYKLEIGNFFEDNFNLIIYEYLFLMLIFFFVIFVILLLICLKYYLFNKMLFIGCLGNFILIVIVLEFLVGIVIVCLFWIVVKLLIWYFNDWLYDLVGLIYLIVLLVFVYVVWIVVWILIFLLVIL